MKKPFLLIITSFFYFSTYAQTTGVFGGDAVASPEYSSMASTTSKWIKLAELTLNGNYNAAGFTMDLFPKNSNHGDSRQQLSVQFRNNSGSGFYTTSNDIVLIHFHGQHKIIKDVKVIHTSGTAVSNNKLSVWVQMGVSWLSSVPIEVRKYGNSVVETTNQPFYSAITDSGTVFDLKTYYGMASSTFTIDGDLKVKDIEADGTIHTKEVKVDLNGWADYVFEKNYDLKTLEETEQYIQQKGHLPNIPSASEVSENGIQLGEMNAKLLEKIEELTLHLIDQNKKMEKMQKEINELKK